MPDTYTSLTQSGWSPTQINNAFSQLMTQLETRTATTSGSSLSSGSGWTSESSSLVLSELFPPETAVGLSDGLTRLASSGMAPEMSSRTGLFGHSAQSSLAPRPPTSMREVGLFPWAVIADPVSVGIMADSLPFLLGLEDKRFTTSNELLVTLGGDLGAPVARLDHTSGIATLHALTNQVPELRAQDPGGKDPEPTPTTPTLSDAAKALISAIVEGFKTAQFEASWWGYKIRFGPEFCKAFPALLLGAEASLGLKALAAFLGTAGFWAGIGAAAAAVGGWIVAALLLYGLYMAAMVAANATPAGVFMCGLWLPGVPLWCKGV